MDEIEFFAPTGQPIRGILQGSEGAWEVRFLSEDETVPLEYTSDGPDVQWDDVTACGFAIFVDGNGEHWLRHHLIIEGYDLPEQSVVEAWRAEVVRTKRGELARQLAATFERGSSERAFWDEACTALLHGPDTTSRIDREKEKLAISLKRSAGLMSAQDASHAQSTIMLDVSSASPMRQRQRLMHLQARLANLKAQSVAVPHGMELNASHFITELMAVTSGIIEVMQVDQVERAG